MSNSKKHMYCITATRWVIAILINLAGILALLDFTGVAFAITSVATQLWLFMPTVVRLEEKLLKAATKGEE